MEVACCGNSFRCDLVHSCEALEGQDPNQREVLQARYHLLCVFLDFFMEFLRH